MNIDELISLITNVGFPAAICFILLRYMLQTMGDKLDKLDNSLNRLTKVIRELDTKRKGKYEELDKFGDSQKEKKIQIAPNDMTNNLKGKHSLRLFVFNPFGMQVTAAGS